MRVLITTNSKHGLCLESVNNMLITTFVNNELITLPTLRVGNENPKPLAIFCLSIASQSPPLSPARGLQSQSEGAGHHACVLWAFATLPGIACLHNAQQGATSPAAATRSTSFVQKHIRSTTRAELRRRGTLLPGDDLPLPDIACSAIEQVDVISFFGFMGRPSRCCSPPWRCK